MNTGILPEYKNLIKVNLLDDWTTTIYEIYYYYYIIKIIVVYYYYYINCDVVYCYY